MNRSDRPSGTWESDPAHFRPPTRRDFLQIGVLGGLGLSLGDVLTLNAGAAAKTGKIIQPKAKSVIQIFLPGGMAAQETFDPKPYAPIEYRGPFGSIGTALPGVRFGKSIPKIAAIADKLTVIRSMTHGEAAHERGVHNMFTGYRPSPALKYPSMGSVVAHEQGPRKNLPPYVAIPNVPNTYAGTGYLSSAYGPFSVGSDPAKKDFQVRDLSLPDDITPEHFERRKSLLAKVDHHFRTLESSDALDAMDSFYQRAYGLISSEQARLAFDMSKETDAVKDRYGRHEAGQRMLLARRLVASGVRFVSLTLGAWDHHADITEGMNKNLPPLDQAFATLIQDLEERGMLEDTLVTLTTEFGRTPKINKDGGRDHYPKVFSVAMAGGGVRKGHVYGASDATSTAVEDDPVTVADFATTLYHQIGIDGEKELMSPGNRPVEIVAGGNVITDILA
ncbi:MAG: hypothetical protein ACI9OU_002124 [Candidatus Promineifilaceae bacterium]|jgi:hypothetical protein